ncbi:MAG TPA: metallophosphoesterase family protein [Candidatus Competibacteraceae bacterium]|nr:metallophosphoesterase family protein [Candidatus Competibacteraceae bacterium]
MRIAVLGDIHSNLEALQAVLADLQRQGVERVLHVGDVVGYCCDFAACIELLTAHGIAGVHGNHDLMALGLLEPTRCIPSARQAIHWTRPRLSASERAFLAALPAELAPGEGLLLFHGAPGDVEEYIRDAVGAERTFRRLQQRPELWIACHGHTHKQRVFEWRDGAVRLLHAATGRVALSRDARYLVCPGSVGVSRDDDARCAYLILDTGAACLELRRIPYDWRTCQRKLAAAGLTTRLFQERPARRGLVHIARRAGRRLAELLRGSP